MKMKYKYIEFEQTAGISGGKPIWACVNRKSRARLLMLIYYVRWRSYVSCFVDRNAVFSSDCLRDISNFLDHLNKAGKE